jgi:DNA-directed RNA polymerase subunit beta
VKVGDVVEAGDIIADGPSTELGELALGRNSLVAFMPWNGYNYEDSILISERIVKDDVFTSIHIEEFEVMARDTKLGPEDITRDIPNVGEEALRNLDEAGIVYIGAEVHPGDILVGKITPKGESPMTPEEKLLRAIFGEKASDVRDTSLRLPPGVAGTIVEVRVFNRHGIDKDDRTRRSRTRKSNASPRTARTNAASSTAPPTTACATCCSARSPPPRPRASRRATTITEEPIWPKSSATNGGSSRSPTTRSQAQLEAVKAQYDETVKAIQEKFEDRKEKLERGDELAPGVLKMVKVFVAVKRKLQPGDKMAGRHGNKGVISASCRRKTCRSSKTALPVDIVLNPLGVPSRMNVGQIFETHLGWAARGLGQQITAALEEWREANPNPEAGHRRSGDRPAEGHLRRELSRRDRAARPTRSSRWRKAAANGVPMGTPVFDGAKEADVADMLTSAGLDDSGQVDAV